MAKTTELKEGLEILNPFLAQHNFVQDMFVDNYRNNN